jgi:hypothetical protein
VAENMPDLGHRRFENSRSDKEVWEAPCPYKVTDEPVPEDYVYDLPDHKLNYNPDKDTDDG